MILCNHCAGRVDPDSLVCTECGEAVLRQQPQPASTGAAIASGATTQPLERTSAHVAPSPPPAIEGARSPGHVSARAVASSPVAEAGGERRKRSERKGMGLAVALAVCVVLVIIVGVAVSTYRQRQRELRAEQEARVDREPFTVERIEVRNATEDKQPLSGVQTGFARSEVRFIQFHLTLRNNAYGIKDIDGQLEVNYIDPSGKVDRSSRSPGSYTVSKTLHVSSDEPTTEVVYGWGNPNRGTFAPGNWRIEFWWKGLHIGSTTFNIY
jgi:hypothetical protein